MRISDWSSDVCSSDLRLPDLDVHRPLRGGPDRRLGRPVERNDRGSAAANRPSAPALCRAQAARLRAPRQAPLTPIGGWPWQNGVISPQGLDSRSEEHTSELQSLMRISYAVFCLKKKKI